MRLRKSVIVRIARVFSRRIGCIFLKVTSMEELLCTYFWHPFLAALSSPEASQRSKQYVGFSIRIITEDGIRMTSFSFLQSCYISPIMYRVWTTSFLEAFRAHRARVLFIPITDYRNAKSRKQTVWGQCVLCNSYDRRILKGEEFDLSKAIHSGGCSIIWSAATATANSSGLTCIGNTPLIIWDNHEKCNWCRADEYVIYYSMKRREIV